MTPAYIFHMERKMVSLEDRLFLIPLSPLVLLSPNSNLLIAIT